MSIYTSNFNASILKFSGQFDHPFLHVLLFGNMFPDVAAAGRL